MREQLMDALDFLARQHREAEALFSALRVPHLSLREREALIIRLIDALTAHASLEERYFYPEIAPFLSPERLEQFLREHLEQKRQIADLLDPPPGASSFAQALADLEETCRSHVEEEEQLFQVLRDQCPPSQLHRWGGALRGHWQELLEGEPP